MGGMLLRNIDQILRLFSINKKIKKNVIFLNGKKMLLLLRILDSDTVFFNYYYMRF